MLAALADRQLGLQPTFYYDTILQRLCVEKGDSFFGVSANTLRLDYNPQPPLFACRFAEASGYEHFLALANEDGRVAIQNSLLQLDCDNTFVFGGTQCHSNAVFDLAWVPGKMSFVTVSGDHSAKLWDVSDGSEIKHVVDFVGHNRSVRTASFRPVDSSIFATGARDGKILIWDTRVQNNVLVITKPDNSIHNCHPYNFPKTPSSASKKNSRQNDRTNSVTGLVFQDDFTLISCGSGDGSIRAWDLRRNYSNFKKDPLPKYSISYCGSSSKSGYSNLLLDKSRMKLFANCVDSVIYCFNIATCNILPEQKYTGHDNNSFYIKSSLSPDSKYLISGSSDNNAYIWNVKCGNPIIKLSGHDAEVTCATWCQVGDIKIATCSDDARHKIWRIGKEYMSETDYSETCGRSYEVHPVEKSQKSWETLDKTPQTLKRKGDTEIDDFRSKRCFSIHKFDVNSCNPCVDSYTSAGKQRSKRSLFNMMGSSSSETSSVKDVYEITPKKRNISNGISSDGKVNHDGSTSGNSASQNVNDSFSDPLYEAKYDGFTTPTKSSKPVVMSPCFYYSPTRILNSPTLNLPNFVIDGKAPHLRSMSPQKKKGNVDWLTKIRQTKINNSNSDKVVNEASRTIEDITNKISTSNMQNSTLLQYCFSVNGNQSKVVNKKNPTLKRRNSNSGKRSEVKSKISRKMSINSDENPTSSLDVIDENEPSTSKDTKLENSGSSKKTILNFFTVVNTKEANSS